MTALLSWDIHTGVSVIACYLYGFENCLDFQCQITECLTLIFNMSAMQTRRCASCAKLRKIRQTHVNNDCHFLLVRLILYHFTCFSIYDLMLLLGRQRQGHPAKSYRRSPFCRLCSCSTPMRSILL